MFVTHKQSATYIYFILVIGLSSLLLVFGLRVKEVKCYQANANPQEIASVCQKLNQAFFAKSLIFYHFTEAAIWQELADTSDYQQLYYPVLLEKDPPGTLLINLASKLPDYRLVIFDEQHQEQSYILNQNNLLKKDQKQTALFSIFYQGEEEILSKNKQYLLEEYHRFFLALKTSLDYYQIDAKNLIWQKNDLLELDLGKSWLVILDKELDPQEKIKNLSLILHDEVVLEEIKKQGFLDLRFRLPVIRKQL